jgi:hypothetical protein
VDRVVAVERELPVKTPLWGKLDFHLHSYASNVTDYYAANALSLPESYSDPMSVYRLLKERGMTLVTLTDHNSIDGVREMLDSGKSDVFISAEMTTTFPEDGCNIHVTVANMTEPQFAEIQRLRTNVYEMIAYVDGQMRGPGVSGFGSPRVEPIFGNGPPLFGIVALPLCNWSRVAHGARACMRVAG